MLIILSCVIIHTNNDSPWYLQHTLPFWAKGIVLINFVLASYYEPVLIFCFAQADFNLIKSSQVYC
jgi:hypothetical protein